MRNLSISIGATIAILVLSACDQTTTASSPSQAPDNSQTSITDRFVIAIKNGETNTVEQLLPSVQSLNSFLVDGLPALSLSIKEGHLDVSEQLLIAGANPDSEDKYGDTALVTAIREHDYEHVLLCLKYGANPNHIHRLRHEPVYFDAILSDQKEILLLLSTYDLDLSLTDGMGDTAASYAALALQYDLVVFFLNLGVDPNHVNVLGMSLTTIAEKDHALADSPGYEFYKETMDILNRKRH